MEGKTAELLVEAAVWMVEAALREADMEAAAGGGQAQLVAEAAV